MAPGHRRALTPSALRIAVVLALLAAVGPGVVRPGTAGAATTTAEVAVVGSAWSESSDGRSSVTIERPEGTQAGHAMVATVAVNGASTGVATPTGWNRIRDDRAGNSVGQAIFVRVASPSEPGSYVFSLSGKPQVAAGITAYSGVDTSVPVEAHGAIVHHGGPVPAPSLPVSTAGARLLNLTAANADGAVAPPAGMVERFEANSPHPKNSKDVLVALADEVVPVAGGTGTRTAVVTPAGPAIGAAVALRPAAAAPPPDTTPPETTIDSGPSGTVDTTSASFTFSADESVLTFRCRLDGGPAEDCSSPRTYSSLANGSHTFEVAAVDLAGNVDPSPATRTWTVEAESLPPPDTTPPETTIDSGPSGTVDTTSASFTFSADESVLTFRCRLDGGPAEDCSSPRTYSGLANGSHTFEVAAVDLAGNVDASPATRTWTVQVPVSGDAVLVGAGDIASCHNDNDEATARLLDGLVAQHPQARVFTTGDNVYDNGTTAEFNNCYDPTWGRHKARTRPAPGNHEYGTAGAAGYFDYFGAAAGTPGQGYYDYMEGGWHVVVLNSQCNAIGGCHAGSAQEQWLRARLADVAAECTVAMWHHPLFSSGSVHGSNLATEALWQALYDHGAELVLNGHDHIYERFAPQTPTGVLDTTFGVRQITAGLGGRSRYGTTLVAPNSQVRYSADYGVLKLSLRSGSYDFEMLRVGDAAVIDSGTAGCHGAPPVEPPPPPVPGTIQAVGSSFSQSSKAQPAISLARPAGVGAGHVMVAHVVSNDDDPGFVAPPGWTLVSDLSISNAVRQAVYYRVATASEPTSYTWHLAVDTTRRLAGGLTAYAGVDNANPIDGHDATVQAAATTAVSAPALVASVPGTLLLHLAAVNAEGTITPPEGMTERWEASSPNPNNTRDALAALADMGLGSEGGSGVRIATASQPGPNIGLAVLLRPVPDSSP